MYIHIDSASNSFLGRITIKIAERRPLTIIYCICVWPTPSQLWMLQTWIDRLPTFRPFIWMYITDVLHVRIQASKMYVCPNTRISPARPSHTLQYRTRNPIPCTIYAFIVSRGLTYTCQYYQMRNEFTHSRQINHVLSIYLSGSRSSAR